jgi:2-(1,2-epoxy-1,2-dihydrophenyl)acetyl-CoA isomerase
MAALDAPVIAQVHGVAAGAGLSLMLQADLVLAAQDTRFNLAYINLGTSCDVGASWALPRLVGLRQALEIALLGDTLDCADAMRLGLGTAWCLPPAGGPGAGTHRASGQRADTGLWRHETADAQRLRP